MKKILTLLIILMGLICFAQQGFCRESKDYISYDHSKNGIYVFKMNTKKMGSKIKPYVSEELITTSDFYRANKRKLRLVVNGGFFDIQTGGAVSYVTVDGKVAETPFSNQKLIEYAGKTNRLEGILNRAEFRVLENNRGGLSFDIDYHFAPTEEGKTIKHSLQGGPIIYPNMNLQKESFIIMKGNKVTFQAADVLKRRERTILALKNDLLYIIIFTSQHKVTMNEVRDFCRKLNVDKAMALDGGASTSLNYKDVEIYSTLGSQRRVKSFLTIEK